MSSTCRQHTRQGQVNRENRLMKKTLKYCSISFGILSLSVILALGILYVVKPGLLRRMLGRVRHSIKSDGNIFAVCIKFNTFAWRLDGVLLGHFADAV